jgi:hypothetical protein
VNSTYGVLDRRIRKTVYPAALGGTTDSINERYVYACDDIHPSVVLRAGDSSYLINRYLWGPGVGGEQVLAEDDHTGVMHWFLSDHQGTVRKVLSSTGTTLRTYDYDAGGNIISTTVPLAPSAHNSGQATPGNDDPNWQVRRITGGTTAWQPAKILGAAGASYYLQRSAGEDDPN